MHILFSQIKHHSIFQLCSVCHQLTEPQNLFQKLQSTTGNEQFGVLYAGKPAALFKSIS